MNFELMRQSWRHLLFLHWPIPIKELRVLVPSQLEIDTWDGEAYIALVAFTMHGIRLPFFPDKKPFAAAFQEVNVRTYVRHKGQSPGVWFFSLDAANAAAVRLARSLYRLKYHFARMRMSVDSNLVEYSSERKWPDPVPAECELKYRVKNESKPVQQSTLDHFLIERYLLYTSMSKTIFTARVAHEPYQFQKAELLSCRENLIESLGIHRSDAPPLVHYSPGTSVTVLAPRKLRGGIAE